MIRQIQQLKLQQKLSPQQIQLVKLLEVTTLEMSERIIREVDENPALELSDGENYNEEEDSDFNSPEDGGNEDFSLDEYATDDDIPDFNTRLPQSGNSGKKTEWVAVNNNMSINEHLLEQIGLHELDDNKKTLAEYIAGSIDENGYLRREPQTLSDDLAINIGIEVPVSEIRKAIEFIQQLDPPGIAACDLRECLILQLKRKPQTETIQKSIQLLEQCFDEFSRKHYESILKKMNCSMDELKQMIKEIVKLNPKPGSIYSSAFEQTMAQVVPDFILENHDGFLQLSLNNSNVPELHISHNYVDMINDFKGNEKNQTLETKAAIQFAKEKVDSARWFIDAVKQRQETLMRTMQAIVDYQYDFFIDGEEKKLRPMILKDIADKTGYDISTISRVSNSKYIQTEFGVYSLKYFFTEGMRMENGDEVSALEIKTILQQNVDAEDKKCPLTDEQLSAILTKKGYVIARRTIAKYREQLGIPVARLRREI